MKKQNAIILSGLILGTLLTGAAGASAQTTDGGDVKDRINQMITLPANQIPLKQPKFLVVNGLKEDANYIMSGDDMDAIMKKTQIEDYDFNSGSAVKDRSDSALQKIKQLFEAGTPATESIELKTGPVTLGELAENLLEINRNATAIVMRHNLVQDAMRAKLWVADAGKQGALGRVELEQAVRSGEELQKRVVEAQRIGFPDDFKVTLEEQDYTLPELKEMGRYVAAASGQVKAAEDAARAAKDAPYLKVLSGDKARIFNDEFGGQGGMWEAYGSGGRILNSPAAMSGESVWFTYGNSRGLVDTWHITGWRFKGDKLVGTVSKSGFGLKPSAGAFR